jgi:hypothetical protein
MTDLLSPPDQWWLASLGRTLIWARLRVREGGTAEVLDSDGNTLNYDSEDTARAMLFDAEFVAYDGLDEEDALARGFSLAELSPPQADDEDTLVARMMQQLGARA